MIKKSILENQKFYTILIFIVNILIFNNNIYSQDPNFHIYLCFGQSNMEGQGKIEIQDQAVNDRFKVLESVNCSNLRRSKGTWYNAVPPLCRCSSGLSPADYFGRTMVQHLPDSITVGIVNVSVAGCKIELFDKDNYQDYVSTITETWLKSIINEYDGNPYQYLVDIAKMAQQDGVIKGILLHQGESNTGDNQWPAKVKKIYNNLMNDLSLNPDSVPLLAGEVVNADQGGVCASMNSIIATLPQTLQNSYVISSAGCTDAADNLHFNSAGYRELGKRYGAKMLSLMGYTVKDEKSKKWVGTWAAAPYAAGTNTPPSPYLANNTLRQIVRTSIAGDTLRVKFSNKTSPTAVTINSVNIAVSEGTSVIDTSTIKDLKFNGSQSVTMNAYSEVTSDPIDFSLAPGMHLAITMHYGQCETSSTITFHYGSRTDSYILEGDQSKSVDFNDATIVERWYNLSSIDVLADPKSASVAVIGNSITDGYGVHNGPGNKWTDYFSEKLLDDASTSHVSVLNLGIGATTVIGSGIGRFQQDILEQAGLRWIIVFYGVNDIGANQSAENIINAYKTMISQAHAKNIRIYGATITPFKGHSYYSNSHEAVRLAVNEWIRKPGNFDKCIDFDLAIRDPIDTSKMHPDYSNDWLHPSAAGYKFMGEYIDVNLFLGADTLYDQPDMSKIESHYFEPECGSVGSNWDIIDDAIVSNGAYINVKAGTQSLTSAAVDSESIIDFPFTITNDSTYYLYARLNCPSADDDSYWMKIDDGSFVMYNNLGTSGWQWLQLESFDLDAGDHTLSITYREDGAKLDKLCISNYFEAPIGMGQEAENLCDLTGTENISDIPDRYGLEQNFPNPFNPTTTINYYLAKKSQVKLRVFDILGKVVATLFEGTKSNGNYEINFDGNHLSSGVYYYRLEADKYVETRKFVLLK